MYYFRDLAWQIFFLTGLVIPISLSHAAEDQKPLPSWAQVQEIVSRQLSAKKNYQPGDLITQSDVKPVFEKLRFAGWKVAEEPKILGALLKDSDFIAQKLRTGAGREFMRQIAIYPGAYDRLYRLASLPSGKKTVMALINGKGGYEMIEYMTTSQGGQNLSKQLSNIPGEKNFAQPTGRIFTEKELVSTLHQFYQKTVDASGLREAEEDQNLTSSPQSAGEQPTDEQVPPTS